ncbi:MAG: hypothetical protein IPN96_23350 [Anaerolineales bacterium]|nr:hypothetical protein [Anaerolineales bacterium]
MKSLNLKFVFVFLLSIAMVLSVSACASDSDAGSEEMDAASAESTEAPEEVEAPAEGGDVVAESLSPTQVRKKFASCIYPPLDRKPGVLINWKVIPFRRPKSLFSKTFLPELMMSKPLVAQAAKLLDSWISSTNN